MQFPENPFIYEHNPYSGSGPHQMVACFPALGVAVYFIVDCEQLDETLQQRSVAARAITGYDLSREGCFRSLPNGRCDNSYNAAPIIAAAYDKAKEIALTDYQ